MIHQEGGQHMARMYAQGGLVCHEIHNYDTNELETGTMSVGTAMERLTMLQDMWKKRHGRVPLDMINALDTAIKAALLQTVEGDSIVKDSKEVTEDEMAEELERLEADPNNGAQVSAMIADARNSDKELDMQMSKLEDEHARAVSKKSQVTK